MSKKELLERIDEYLVKEEFDADKMARWGETFGKNHGKYPDEKGFHELCVEHMEGNVDDPAAYCARVKDAYQGSTYWRGKGKQPKEAESDVKKHQNIQKGEREPAEKTKSEK